MRCPERPVTAQSRRLGRISADGHDPAAGSQGMTMRASVMRRSSQHASRTTIFLLVAGALVTLSIRSFVIRFACGVVIAVVAVAAFWTMFQIPCLKCRKPLGIVGFKVANSGIGSRAVPAHCPHCNVSFDEPIDRPAGS
jgi:hypothetical protein